MSQFDSLFDRVGQKYGIPPNILKSIATVESGLDPNAEGDLDLASTRLGSSAGMFQFRTGTAKDYGLIDDQGNDYRKDPEKAADAAARKLVSDAKYFRQKLGSNATPTQVNNLAIMAYNGGRGGVNTTATQAYLSKVQANLAPQQTAQAPQDDDEDDVLPGSSVFQNYQPPSPPEDVQDVEEDDDVLPGSGVFQNTLPGSNVFQNYTVEKEDKVVDVDAKSTTEAGYSITKTKLPAKLKNEDILKDENFGIIKEYLERRIGKDNLKDNYGLDETKSSREDYIERFLSHMREVEYNTTFGGVPELNYIYNATDEDVLIAGKAHEIYEKMPDFYDGKIEGFFEVTKEIFTDPLNYIGAGVGTALKFKLAREGINAAIKNKIRKEVVKKNKDLSPRDIELEVNKAFGNKTTGELAKLEKAEITKLNAKAFVLGGGAEAAVAINASAIQQNIDKELQRREAVVMLSNQYAAKLITEEEAIKQYEEVKERTKVSAEEVLRDAGMALLLGGLSGIIPTKVALFGKRPGLLSSKEILQGSDAYSALKMDKKPTAVNIDAVSKLFAENIQKDLEDTIFKNVDFNKVDLSKLKLKKKYTKESFKEAVARGEISLSKMAEADLKAAFGDQFLKEALDVKDITFTEAALSREMFRGSLQVAFEIMMSNPARFRDKAAAYINKEENVTKVLTDVFSLIEDGQIDQDVLANALSRAGLKEKDISRAVAYQASTLGSMLNDVSQFGKAIKKYVDLNPDLKSLSDLTFAERKMAETTGMFGGFLDRIKNLERNSKALVVSSIGTTVRNVFGTSIGLSLDSATKLLDIGIYGIAKGTQGIFSGNLKQTMTAFDDIVDKASFNMGQIWSTVTSITPGKQIEIADKFDMILRDDMRTKNLLLNSLQEVGDKNKLWWISRTANTFNVAQDAVFRRGVFVNSISRQLKNVGQDLDSILANNQKIPMNVIKNASDEALQATFAKLPDVVVDPKGLEQKISSMAGGFIKFLENFPGTSLIVPFPRFMANAMAFQYKYSVFQFPKFMSSMKQGAELSGKLRKKLIEDIEYNRNLKKEARERFTKLAEEGKIKKEDIQKRVDGEYKTRFRRGANPEIEEDLLRQQDLAAAQMFAKGREELARGIVGGSLLLYAYQYRRDNQDTNWFNIKNSFGETVDIRAIFPIAPWLALGDALVKLSDPDKKDLRYDRNDYKGTFEALTGTKMVPIGFADTMTDIFETFNEGEDAGSKAKVEKLAGTILGDFANRFQQPLQPLYGYLDAFDKEYGVARDVEVVEDDQGAGRVWETAMNRFMARGSAAAQDAVANFISEDNPYVADIFSQYVPITKKTDMPPALRFFNPNKPVRGGEFFNTFVGFRVTPRVNEMEQLFNELDINPWPTYGSTGDKKYDRMVISESYKYIIGDETREGLLYQSVLGDNPSSRIFQRQMQEDRSLARNELRKFLSNCVRAGRLDANIKLQISAEGQNRLAKLWFNRLPEDIRDSIDKKAREIDGKTLSASKKYIDAYLYHNIIFPDIGYDIPYGAIGKESGIEDAPTP